MTRRAKKALLSLDDSRAFARTSERNDYGRPCAVLSPPDDELLDDDEPEDELAPLLGPVLPLPAERDPEEGPQDPPLAEPSPLLVYPCPLTTRPCGCASPFTTTTGT